MRLKINEHCRTLFNHISCSDGLHVIELKVIARINPSLVLAFSQFVIWFYGKRPLPPEKYHINLATILEILVCTVKLPHQYHIAHCTETVLLAPLILNVKLNTLLNFKITFIIREWKNHYQFSFRCFRASFLSLGKFLQRILLLLFIWLLTGVLCWMLTNNFILGFFSFCIFMVFRRVNYNLNFITLVDLISIRVVVFL